MTAPRGARSFVAMSRKTTSAALGHPTGRDICVQAWGATASSADSEPRRDK